MQIVGPAWLNTETYDINAKLHPDTPLAQMQLMLQGLLAESVATRYEWPVHDEAARAERQNSPRC